MLITVKQTHRNGGAERERGGGGERDGEMMMMVKNIASNRLNPTCVCVCV